MQCTPSLLLSKSPGNRSRQQQQQQQHRGGSPSRLQHAQQQQQQQDLGDNEEQQQQQQQAEHDAGHGSKRRRISREMAKLGWFGWWGGEKGQEQQQHQQGQQQLRSPRLQPSGGAAPASDQGTPQQHKRRRRGSSCANNTPAAAAEDAQHHNQDAAAAAAAGSKQRQVQQGGGRSPAPAAAAAADGGVLTPGVKLGCSKCRYSAKGCKVCREQAAQQQQQQGQALDQPEAGGSSKRAGTPSALQQLARKVVCRSPKPPAAGQAVCSGGVEDARLGATNTTNTQQDRSSSSSTPLQGMSFLVTGFPEQVDRSRVCRLITKLGGTLLINCPAPPALGGSSQADQQQQQAAAAASHQHQQQQQQQHAVDVLVCDAERNTTKYLFAAATGVPVYTEAWLQACAAAGKVLHPAAPKPKRLSSSGGGSSGGGTAGLVLRPRRDALLADPAARVLWGLRVLLLGGERWRGVFADVIGHAGGVVVQDWDRAATVTRQLLQHLQEAGVDLIVVDTELQKVAAARGGSGAGAGAADADALRQLPGLQAAAARARVPVVDVDCLVQSVLQGSLPADVMDVLKSKQQRQQQILEQQQQQQQGASGGRKRRSSAVAAAGAADAAAEHQVEDVQGQVQQEGSETQARKRHKAGHKNASPEAAAASPQPARSQQQQQQHVQASPPKPQQQQQPEVQISWLQPMGGAGRAAASPTAQGLPGAALLSPIARFRTQYEAFTLTITRQGAGGPQTTQRVVRRGDFVLVAPLLGEDSPRLVQLTSLWQETPSAGVARQFGRGRRFYHPSDTMFGIGGNKVFMTDHWEERLPLAAVLDRCRVVFPGSQQQEEEEEEDAADAGLQQFVCEMFYNHVDVMLRCLSAEEVPIG